MLLEETTNMGLNNVKSGGSPTPSSTRHLAKGEADNELNGQICPVPKQERPSLVELKNGKVVLRQKNLALEKTSETLQELVQFRALLEERAKENCPPLQSIPDDHLPLIAKLIHESEKTIVSLAKHVQEALQPEDLATSHADDIQLATAKRQQLTLAAIENAILAVADRVNYGVDWMERASASLSLWRWEVRDERFDFLPGNAREKVQARIAERQQAKEELRALIDALPQSERDALQKGSKRGKGDTNANVQSRRATSVNDENSHIPTPSGGAGVAGSTSGPSEESKKDPGRPKKQKVIDAEQMAKDKERAERKAAKAEKERKEKEAQSKSRFIMSSFFTKPKGGNTRLSPVGSPPKLEASSSRSAFEQTFKPFVVKKDVTLSPTNWFEHSRKGKEVIVIDQDSMAVQSERKSGPLSMETTLHIDPKGVLSSFIDSVPVRSRLPRKTRALGGTHYKSTSAYCVRTLITQLSEAEVVGDVSTVRSIHVLLRSRSKIPAKVLIFHEDTRPGYFGTFTKSSTVVGSRSPFGKDAVAFDYSYDSGEDWEEEEAGEDVMSQDGSDGESNDVASDLDDWLVDDDDDIEPGTPISERGRSPACPDIMPTTTPTNKRKLASVPKKETKKRKVMPLVPFTKGPCWEEKIGECELNLLNQYRIQLFNDTPFPIDPFTFVSAPVVQETHAPPKQAFAIPPLPAHVRTASNSSSASFTVIPQPMTIVPVTAETSSASVAVLPTRRKATSNAPPKTPFPDALVPLLADKISSLATGNLTWLIESLYQDLKTHKVKKNSIEAKVREVVEKCPTKKIWIVKYNALRSNGITSKIEST